MLVLGAVKGAKSIDVPCGAPDCEGNHTTYDAFEVVDVQGGMLLDDVEDDEVMERCIADGRMWKGTERLYPTVPGVWWSEVCDN